MKESITKAEEIGRKAARYALGSLTDDNETWDDIHFDIMDSLEDSYSLVEDELHNDEETEDIEEELWKEVDYWFTKALNTYVEKLAFRLDERAAKLKALKEVKT